MDTIMSHTGKAIILIKEDQQNIAELILFAVEKNFNIRGVICNDMEAIQDWLIHPSLQGVVVSSPTETCDSAAEIYNTLSQQDKPSLFISLEGSEPINWEKHSLPLPDATIKRSKCINELVKVIDKNFIRQDEAPAEKYTRISMSPLANFKNIDEDIFIKLKSGRYLKLFSEGDNVTIDDIQKYQRKGLQELYIQREAYSWVLGKIDSRLSQMIENPGMQLDMAEIKTEPLNETDQIPIEGPVHLEEEFLEFLHTQSEQLVKGMMKTKSLSKYLKGLKINRTESEYFTTRIGITSNIACGIIQKLEWGQGSTYEKLLYAIHTHDISLMASPELMKFQTVEEIEADGSITEEQKKIFLEHPEKSTEVALEDPFAPSDVDSLIIQHHELPNREGFPAQLPSSKIQPLASILIVSIDFAQLVMGSSSTDPLIQLRKLKLKYKSSGFIKVIKTLEELLDPSIGKQV